MTEIVHVVYSTSASPEEAFEAWVNPDIIAKWIVIPANDEVLKIQVNAVVGGQFSFLNLRNAQKIDHIGEYFVGEYFVVDRPNILSFSWGIVGYPMGDSRVTITFTAVPAGTLVSLSHSGVDKEYTERTHMGWSKITGAIASVLESQEN